MVVNSTSRSDTRSRWQGHLTGLALALAVLAGTLIQIRGETVTFVPPATWVECLIFVSAGAALVAHRFPYVALGVAAVLDAVPYWLPIGGAGYHLSLMIAVYMVMANRRTRQATPVVGAVFGVQVGLMAWDMEWHWSSMYVAAAALTVALPAALGLASHSRSMATDALRQRALAAERSREADARQLLAEDRLRTARELHDSVAHQIAVMNLNAGVASRTLHERPDEAEAALITVREAGRAVISSISDLLTSLREGEPDATDEQYCLGDIRILVKEFQTLSPDLTAAVGEDGPVTNGPISPVLYSVVREALTNAYKHGQRGSPTHLDVRWDAGVWCIEATNTPAAESAATGEGFGLRGMRERVEAVGGRLSIEETGEMFTLRARVPGGASPP